MTTSRHLRLALVLAVSLVTPLLAQQKTTSATEPPRIIRLSGTVDDNTVRRSGTATAIFALYDSQGASAPLWTEVQSLRIDVSGRYSILLGANTTEGVPASMFADGQPRWIGVTIDGREQPRMQLVSVPYALKAGDADRVNGLSAAEIAANAASIVMQSSAPSSEIITRSAMQPKTGATSQFISTAVVSGSAATTFTDSTTDQVVRVIQNGTGRAVWASNSGDAPTIYARNTSTSGTSSYAVLGQTSSSGAAGVRGQADGTTAPNIGVWGISMGPGGTGILGEADDTSTLNYGLRGKTASTIGIGLQGQATATSGASTGVRAAVSSPQGTAMLLDGVGGKLLSARTNFIEKLSIDNSGNLVSLGSVTANSFSGSGAGLTNLSLGGTYSNLVAFTNAGNSFVGSFSGNGSGLTNVNAATLNGFTAAQLGTVQSITFGTGLTGGTITGTGNVGLDLTYLDGRYLSGSGGTTSSITATNGIAATYPTPSSPSSGSNSSTIDLIASSYNMTTGQPIDQTFRFQAIPNANNSASPNAKLRLSFATSPDAFSPLIDIGHDGTIAFVAGQSFPGTITGATANGGLTQAGSTLGLMACGIGQVLAFSGSSWGCASPTLGTVTQVALAAPADFAVTGSPVNGSGTLTFDWVTAPDSANTASAIVKRDSNGAFSAGVITAAGATVDQPADGATVVQGKRATDSTPTGNFIHLTSNDAATTLFNVDVNGAVSAGSFTGNGSGLTNVAAASIAPGNITSGTANINISGNAATATTATSAGSASTVPASGVQAGTANIDISGNAATATSATTANTAATATFATSAGSATSATTFTGTLGGDVIGTQSVTTVTKIRNFSVASTVPSTGQIFTYTGGSWRPASIQRKQWFPVGTCIGTTPSLQWGDVAGASATFLCQNSGIMNQAFAVVNAGELKGGSFTWTIPSSWDGTLSMRMKWHNDAATGTSYLFAGTYCIQDGSADTIPSLISIDSAGFTSSTNIGSGSLTIYNNTTCHAGDLMYIFVGSNASDDKVYINGVEISFGTYNN